MDDTQRADLWYEVVEDSELWQGDIIRSLLIFNVPQATPVVRVPPAADAQVEVGHASWSFGDWIVMSASCDLDRKLEVYPFALVCPVYPATAEVLHVKESKLAEHLEVIRTGLSPLKYLLAEHPSEPTLDLSYAQFRPHFGVPIEYLKRACVGKRLRLRPPYREAFGIWVGNNFTRVGVKDDAQIPKFTERGEPSGAARLAAAEVECAPAGRRMTPPKGNERDGGQSLLRRLSSWALKIFERG